MRSVYIGHIECSPAVAERISSKHGISLQDVRDAVQWPARPLRAARLGEEIDRRGPRLAAEGLTASGRILKVVLYPVDEAEGTWRLGTAVPLV